LRPSAENGSASVDVLLLRHAPTGWSTQHRRQGWDDQQLTFDGRRAARTWPGRRDVKFAAVVASDLARARETAQIIAAELGLGDVAELAGLREQDQGAWTGLTKEQIKRQWPDRLRERPRRPVGGEPPEAVLERVLASLNRMAAVCGCRRVLVVTHSGVIRILEWAIEVEAPPVPHLEGRWLRVTAAVVRRGEPAIRSVDAGELTAGRRALAAVPDGVHTSAEGG
jgi:broad specificity phosphatase PhoE